MQARLRPDRTQGFREFVVECDGELWGHVKDPLTGGMSLDAITGPGYFGRADGGVLCFGAGGSGKAMSLHLINKGDPADRPKRMVVTNRSPGRLAKLRAMVESPETDITFEYIQNVDPTRNDAIMEDLADGSVVINATGMGKDTPGSPVTDDGLFPRNGIAWEINYRGELDFWHQAMAQQHERNLTIEDGWLYFLHGWTQVIAEVLHSTSTTKRSAVWRRLLRTSARRWSSSRAADIDACFIIITMLA